MFLMANLGSEIERVFSASEMGDSVRLQSAAERAFAIINSLRIHTDLEGRTREVDIIENVLNDLVNNSHLYAVKRTDLASYFMPFAQKALSGL